MRPAWLALTIVLFLLAVLAFAGGAFAQIIVCEYDFCAEEKHDALIRWWGYAVVLAVAGFGAPYTSRSARRKD
jgi:hypothetical protein